MSERIGTLIKWIRYIKRPWYRNHSLGMRYFITNKKGDCEYCYRCGNYSNQVVTKYIIFRVPICRPHLEQEYKTITD